MSSAVALLVIILSISGLGNSGMNACGTVQRFEHGSARRNEYGGKRGIYQAYGRGLKGGLMQILTAYDVLYSRSLGHFERHVIATEGGGIHSLCIGDMDGDQRTDLVTGEVGGDINWRRGLGNGNYGPPDLIGHVGDLPTVSAFDVDGDGNTDIIAAGFFSAQLVWLKNDGEGQFRSVELTMFLRGAAGTCASDLDGDGDADIVAAASGMLKVVSGRLVWWENEGRGTFVEHILDASFDGAESVCAADIDGDGDIDIVGASTSDGVIAWWENDGNGTFARHAVGDSFDGAELVSAADMDGDRDTDIVGVSRGAGIIAWWENDGKGAFARHGVNDSLEEAGLASAADMDGDGDIDIVGASRRAGAITWWENNGKGTFARHVVTDSSDGAELVNAADMDGDGDTDIVTASRHGVIAWWENRWAGLEVMPGTLTSGKVGR